MSRAEEFDAFYVETRDQLLLETYAISGDLSASRAAVRDAYAVAWQRWAKVSRLTEREGWLRPLAYRRAQRRHSAKVWQRHRSLDDGGRATLDALAGIKRAQRQVLVLAHLAPVTTEQLIRTVGRPLNVVERDLATATTAFATARDIDDDLVGEALEELRPLVDRIRWPQAGVVRRQGATRRRVLTVAAVAATAGAMVLSGTALSQGENASAVSLHEESVLPPVSLRPVAEGTAPVADESVLLSLDQATRTSPRLEWSETATTGAENAPPLACEAAPVAELGTPAQVRSFTGTSTKGGRSKDTATLTQAVLTAADAEASEATHATVLGWFTRCSEMRSQLLTTSELDSVGDEAHVFTLRTWTNRPADLTLAVARSGSLTYALTWSSSAGALDATDAARLLSVAVNKGCTLEGAGACAGAPEPKRTAPLPIGEPPGLLSVVDLPPVSRVKGPWVGTEVSKPGDDNAAATPCDKTRFNGRSLRSPLGRTFLFPETPRTDALGLGQSTALTSRKGAQAFVDGVRKRIRSCADGYGKEVAVLTERDRGDSAVTMWRIRMELNSGGTATFHTAIMRRGNAVSQVTFSAAKDMTMTSGDFEALVERAMERMQNLPGYKA
ncbi:MAG: hypothetical protein ACI379_12545 [Nocardioides sp.]|uniref:hypothetical protein n=1 Tax=Nocardioides sp. TaxID=35761 RepID=UPI003F00F668